MAMVVPGDQDEDLVPEAGGAASEAARVAALEEYRSLLRAAEELLDDVDRALASLDDGTYGACEECGCPVEERVLAGNPLAVRCATHCAAGDA